MIRPINDNDVDEIAKIHLESFRGFFLTFLGRDFLVLLYKSMHKDPEGLVLVATYDGKIEGFVAGVTDQSGFYKRLIRNHLRRFVLATLGALAKRPSIAPRLVRAFHRPEESQEAGAKACLMSIAVSPESEGKGVGRQLVKAFCNCLYKRGVPAVCLTTDRDNNERVNGFYEQLGFSLSRSYLTAEGRAMNEYVLSFDKEPA